MTKKEKNTPKRYISIEVGSLSDVLTQPEILMDQIESTYYLYCTGFSHKKKDLTVVISGTVGDRLAEEILTSFRESYSTYFDHKHERACLNSKGEQAWKSIRGTESKGFYEDLANATVEIREYRVVK